MYCDTAGLSLPVADCDAGWYCPNGSSSARQIICPRGYFCPTGNDIPEPCRNGTYGDSNNLLAESECRPCDPGYYCNATAAVAVTAACDPGYYCPEGQTTPNPTEYLCWMGHMCAGGNGLPDRCADGYYQNEQGQSDCKPCPAGEYSVNG